MSTVFQQLSNNGTASTWSSRARAGRVGRAFNFSPNTTAATQMLSPHLGWITRKIFSPCFLSALCLSLSKCNGTVAERWYFTNGSTPGPRLARRRIDKIYRCGPPYRSANRVTGERSTGTGTAIFSSGRWISENMQRQIAPKPGPDW